MFFLSSLFPPPPSHHHPPTLCWALLTGPSVFPVFGGGALWSELVGWAPQWAWPGADRKTEWEGKKERKKERASMAEVQYCGLKWLMAYGKSCCFSPPLSGGPSLLCFCSLYVFELIDYIRTDEHEDLPGWKTVGGFCAVYTSTHTETTQMGSERFCRWHSSEFPFTVLHGSLKPSNVSILETSQFLVCKICRNVI